MNIPLLLLFLLLPLTASAQVPAQPAVAVTFDDLPYAGASPGDDAQLLAMTDKLLHALRAQGVPAVGFVNEAKLYRGGELDEARVGLLRLWLDAGVELGNHTYSHLSLNRVPLELFEADLLKGERITRPLMQDHGMRLRWFRPPFLHLGSTPAVRAAFQEFLTRHGYVVAPVTVNSAEWIFAAAYANAQAAGDQTAARRIGEAYVPYMAAVFDDAESQAFDLFGRRIPQVLLLHASSLNADYFAELVLMLKCRGYHFITLGQALEDPAYRSPMEATDNGGESWLELWAHAAGLYAEKAPPLPASVRQWAGVAAYRGY